MRSSRSPVLWFVLLAYGFTGVGQCVHLYVSHRLTVDVPGGTPLHETPIMTWVRYAPYVTGTGPSLAGLLMTLFLYGIPGIRRMAIQLTPWSVGRAWAVLAVCLLLPVVVIVLPMGILAALGVSVPTPSLSGTRYLYSAVVGGGFIGAGLFEELGWRGFALPHLQRRYSALGSSVLIGLVWAFWHLPNFVIPSEPPPWLHVLAYVLLVMAFSVLFTWAYNSTGGSLFTVVVLHGALNAALELCASADSGVAARQVVVFGLLFSILAVGLVGRYGAADLSRHPRVLAPRVPASRVVAERPDNG